MSSAMRLSIMMVLLLTATALGLFVYMNQTKPGSVQAVQSAPPPLMVSYFVAAHPLPAGTLARDEDFSTRSVPSSDVPSGVIIDTADARIGLRGSLIRTFLDTGSLVTSADVLRPRDRGFLASVLEPGTRALSINVDAASGVSGLIWPGDHVDVVLTHDIDKAANSTHQSVTETILRDARVIGIDQEIVQGAPSNTATAGKLARTVTLELQPDQVVQVAEAQHLGKLSLAIRSAVEVAGTTENGIAFNGDVSKARAATTLTVYEGTKSTEFTFQTGGKDGR